MMIVIEVSGLSFCFWVPENADFVHFAAGKKRHVRIGSEISWKRRCMMAKCFDGVPYSENTFSSGGVITTVINHGPATKQPYSCPITYNGVEL
ncbi:hypothetical protein Peur_060197 [Populus x canadensis]